MKKMILFNILLVLFGCADTSTEPANRTPKILSIFTTPSSVRINETITISCIATDEDGDDLSYIWSAHEGAFPYGAFGSSVNWTTPVNVGTYTISVIVSDMKKTIEDSLLLIVSSHCPNIPTVSYAGKIYNTVQIGNQCWLKENLNIGVMLDSDSSDNNQTDNGIIEKFCYNNDTNNCNTYGGLYQWNEAMQYTTTEEIQGICPHGWHMPTYKELQTLSITVGNSSNALKARDQGDEDGVGTDTNGFSALLAGSHNYHYDYDFFYLEEKTFFWSSTENGNYPYSMNLDHLDDNIYYHGNSKDYGYSIRCLKD